MRSIIACWLVGIVMLASSASAAEMQLSEVVQLYEKVGRMPHERCDPIVKATLEANADKGVLGKAALIKASKALEKQHCLDQWSSFAPEPTSQKPITIRARWESEFLYIQITEFRGATVTLTEVLKEVASIDTIHQIVLDLRDNPGGSVDDLADMLNMYFSPRAGLEYMQVDATDYPKVHVTNRRGLFSGTEITILVNGETISAAEWMVAQLKMWYPVSVRVLGEQTRGKAVIQCIRPTKSNSAVIRVTCGEWRMGDQKVQGIGIKPDEPFTLAKCDGDAACIKRLFARH